MIALALGFAITTPTLATTNILVLGDSLSAAHGIDPEKGWVTLLQQRLQAKGYDYKVINSSISGSTTSNGDKRINELLTTYTPAIVILGLGSNDGLRGLSTLQMQKNLTDIVVQAKKSNAKVLLIGFLIPTNYGPDYREQFKKVYAAVAAAQKLPRVPFLLEKVALDPSLMQDDRVHPNEKAQPMILENVWIYLEAMLKK